MLERNGVETVNRSSGVPVVSHFLSLIYFFDQGFSLRTSLPSYLGYLVCGLFFFKYLDLNRERA
jgi:hypothetical protein